MVLRGARDEAKNLIQIRHADYLASLKMRGYSVAPVIAVRAHERRDSLGGIFVSQMTATGF